MNKHKLYRYSRKIHKWVGLFIGIQVLFWIAGGLIMSSLPLHKVHGKHLHSNTASEVDINHYKVSLDSVLKSKNLTPKQVKFYSVGNIPIYEILTNKTEFISGITGLPLRTLEESEIKKIASDLYTGSDKIKFINKISNIPLEASRIREPVWKIVFDDSIDTTFYINQFTGKLMVVRSDIWRLFDFVWMLHIMDYDTRDDFNNPLLISFAASALIFTISGIILIFQVFSRRDFKFLKRA